MRRLISSGSRFETDIGYSRAVVDGDWIFVSGTTGFDYATMAISEDVAEQAEQTLANIAAALAAHSQMWCASATSFRGRRISRPAGRRCSVISARCDRPQP
jgi:enamine deaminase RidA (YjgF/YER057c/UK114 family)